MTLTSLLLVLVLINTLSLIVLYHIIAIVMFRVFLPEQFTIAVRFIVVAYFTLLSPLHFLWTVFRPKWVE